MGGSQLPCRGQEAPQSALPVSIRLAAAVTSRSHAEAAELAKNYMWIFFLRALRAPVKS